MLGVLGDTNRTLMHSSLLNALGVDNPTVQFGCAPCYLSGPCAHLSTFTPRASSASRASQLPPSKSLPTPDHAVLHDAQRQQKLWRWIHTVCSSPLAPIRTWVRIELADKAHDYLWTTSLSEYDFVDWDRPAHTYHFLRRLMCSRPARSSAALNRECQRNINWTSSIHPGCARARLVTWLAVSVLTAIIPTVITPAVSSTACPSHSHWSAHNPCSIPGHKYTDTRPIHTHCLWLIGCWFVGALS